MYVYCGNDGVNQVDPSGHDAIWLNSSKSASGFGHAALLIKNSHGKWDYLSYTGDGLLKKTLSNYYSKANYRFVLQFINDKYRNEYRNKGDMGPYDGYIYLKGKFKSVKKKTIKNKKKYKGSSYRKIYHNCLDIAVDILRKGKFKRYNQKYHAALGYAMAMSIPNNAFAGMTYFDDTIDSYMKAGHVRRLFINPYKVFINLMQRGIIT